MGPSHGFKPKCLLMLKIGLTLANSDRTACTNMLSNNSDSWRLAMQACFSLKIQHISMGCHLSLNYKKLLVYKKHCNGFICTVKDL